MANYIYMLCHVAITFSPNLHSKKLLFGIQLQIKHLATYEFLNTGRRINLNKMSCFGLLTVVAALALNRDLFTTATVK